MFGNVASTSEDAAESGLVSRRLASVAENQQFVQALAQLPRIFHHGSIPCVVHKLRQCADVAMKRTQITYSIRRQNVIVRSQQLPVRA